MPSPSEGLGSLQVHRSTVHMLASKTSLNNSTQLALIIKTEVPPRQADEMKLNVPPLPDVPLDAWRRDGIMIAQQDDC